VAHLFRLERFTPAQAQAFRAGGVNGHVSQADTLHFGAGPVDVRQVCASQIDIYQPSGPKVRTAKVGT
jgi:hypothetical protein